MPPGVHGVDAGEQPGIQQGVVVRGSSGAISRSISRMRGVDTDDARFPNTAQARLSSRPDRSSATTVLSNAPRPSRDGRHLPLLGHPGEQASRQCSG